MIPLKPLFDQVAVKESQPENMRKSGLMIPVDTQRDAKPPQQGVVLAIGPGLDWWSGQGIEMPVQPGDHILFPWSAGVYVEVEEERLLVMRVGLILAVLE
jgi:chaperonin GroES